MNTSHQKDGFSERSEVNVTTLRYSCGCSVTRGVGGSVVSVDPCSEHGQFDGVRKAWRMLRDALEEAHDQLPPGPFSGPKEAA